VSSKASDIFTPKQFQDIIETITDIPGQLQIVLEHFDAPRTEVQIGKGNIKLAQASVLLQIDRLFVNLLGEFVDGSGQRYGLPSNNFLARIDRCGLGAQLINRKSTRVLQ